MRSISDLTIETRCDYYLLAQLIRQLSQFRTCSLLRFGVFVQSPAVKTHDPAAVYGHGRFWNRLFYFDPENYWGLENFLTGRCIYFNRTFRPDKCSNKTRSVLFKRTGLVRIWYMKMSLTEIRTWNRLISFVRYRLIHTVDNLQAQRFICLQWQQAVAVGKQLFRF